MSRQSVLKVNSNWLSYPDQIELVGLKYSNLLKLHFVHSIWYGWELYVVYNGSGVKEAKIWKKSKSKIYCHVERRERKKKEREREKNYSICKDKFRSNNNIIDYWISKKVRILQYLIELRYNLGMKRRLLLSLWLQFETICKIYFVTIVLFLRNCVTST